MKIRRALLDDAERLYEIEKECFTFEALSREQIVSFIRDKDSTALVAQVNGEIAGFIIGKIYTANGKHAGHVITIDVAVKHRRKGVGKQLLEALERIFLERGVKFCYLEARADNISALNLYRKMGYVELEKLEGYYGDVHGIRMRKNLRAP